MPVHIHATGFGGGSPSGPFRKNAGYPFLDEAIALMYRYPNVYADLSTITWILPRNGFYR